MKTIFSKSFFLALLSVLIFSCNDDIDEQLEVDDCLNSGYTHCLEFGPGQEEEINIAFLTIENSTRIKLKAGTYYFDNLSLVNVRDILIIGEGPSKTKLDFSSQTSGGEGVRVTGATNFTIKGLTLMESAGDLIKVANSENVTFNNIHAIWKGVGDSTSGGYAIYPVLCKNVLIDSCLASGASDAGIYVGQTQGAIVRNSVAYKNVAGCEIENTQDAEVYDNEFYDNTGGFLIFDFPNLSQRGGNIRAYNNYIHHNNFKNFAPASSFGTTVGVGNVPPGCGVVLSSTSDVEIFNNKIAKNNLASMLLVSGLVLDENALDYVGPNFYPFPTNIKIYDNEMIKDHQWPEVTLQHEFGELVVAMHLYLKLTSPNQHPFIQHILIGGDNSNLITGGTEENPDNICIDESEFNLFLNMKVIDGFDAINGNIPFESWTPSRDVTNFECL
ncbi:MAG: parallel beta-helix domain-containing protein [Chitinophagales bacterium]